MASLKFDRLIIISHMHSSARQLKFHKRFNLVTANNNSVGKSCLVKAIFWVLGCEPIFDQAWKSMDCHVLLDFSIDNDSYTVARRNLSICLRKNGVSISFPKITGRFSEEFAKITNFTVKLPSKAQERLEVPPPAYYFLPFYIDQIKGWSSLWDSFSNLAQYSNWKRTVVNYHTGYTKPEFFTLEDKIYTYKATDQEQINDIKEIDSAINIVEKFIPKENIAINPDELIEIERELIENLSALHENQSKYFIKISLLESEKYDLVNQLKIVLKSVKEIEKDYLFTVEQIEGDLLECPICGTLHDNSLVSRASILSDK